MREQLFKKSWEEFFHWILKTCNSVVFKLLNETTSIKSIREISWHETVGIRIKVRVEYHSISHRDREVSYPRSLSIYFYEEAQPTIPTTFTTYTQKFPLKNTKEILTCPTCNGRGKVTCPKCGGSGKLRCPSCFGSGKCSVCGGSGKKFCFFCNGTGYRYDEKCTACGGRGYTTCNACGGSGICSTCHGSGKITCYKCGGSGWITCKRCDGSGKIVTFTEEIHKFYNKSFSRDSLESDNLKMAFNRALDKKYYKNIKKIEISEITRFYNSSSDEVKQAIQLAKVTYEKVNSDIRSHGHELFREEQFFAVPINYLKFKVNANSEKYLVLAGLNAQKYVVKTPALPKSIKKIFLQSFYLVSPFLLILYAYLKTGNLNYVLPYIYENVLSPLLYFDAFMTTMKLDFVLFLIAFALFSISAVSSSIFAREKIDFVDVITTVFLNNPQSVEFAPEEVITNVISKSEVEKLVKIKFPVQLYSRLVKRFRESFSYEWPIHLRKILDLDTLSKIFQQTNDILDDKEHELFKYFLDAAPPVSRECKALLYGYGYLNLDDSEIVTLFDAHKSVIMRTVNEKPYLVKGWLWKTLDISIASETIKYGSYVTAETLIWLLSEYLEGKIRKSTLLNILNDFVPFDSEPLISVIQKNNTDLDEIVTILKKLGIHNVIENTLKKIKNEGAGAIAQIARQLL